MEFAVHGVTKSRTQLSDIHFTYVLLWASPVSKLVKSLSVMQETRVQSLGQEDPLEKGMTNHSSILPWRIPWTGKPGGLQSLGHSQTRLSSLHFYFHMLFYNEYVGQKGGPHGDDMCMCMLSPSVMSDSL